MASKDTSCFPADHNSGNVYRLADNFSFATSVVLGVDILLQLWKRISISTHLELDDRWHDSCEAIFYKIPRHDMHLQAMLSFNKWIIRQGNIFCVAY